MLVAIAMLLVALQRDFPGGSAIYLVVTALIGLLVTTVHEGGHALMARRLGARLLVFAVGSVQFDFTRRAWRIRRERSREVGGFVAYSLPDTHETSRKHVMIAAAGPLANLACAALLAVLLQVAAVYNGDPPRPAVVEMTQGTPGAAPTRLPDAQAIDRALEHYRARRTADALRQHLETLAILLVMASLGAAMVNLLPFDESDGAVIKAHWGR